MWDDSLINNGDVAAAIQDELKGKICIQIQYAGSAATDRISDPY